jgi:hypothetical protein
LLFVCLDAGANILDERGQIFEPLANGQILTENGQ